MASLLIGTICFHLDQRLMSNWSKASGPME